jgi:hypothetical protein
MAFGCFNSSLIQISRGGQQSPLSKTGVSLKESKETQRIRDADPLINWLGAYDRLISVKNFLKADSSASCLDVEA